ncbi:hypothetical protein [Celeribacter sp.]|uniref:hypothetical protein n=1 Tax=Celeribacter sp. TaxID=1890673 RepID=UPI003A8DFB20
MIRIATVLALLATLAACGADGAPSRPIVSGKQTVGVNSNTGAYSETKIGITFPIN